MKKKLLYCLTALLALGFSSCKDDDEIMGAVDPSKDFNRMPMTQFRQQETTGKDENADPYSSRVITEELNSIELRWYGIEGAAGYEIKYGPNAGLSSGKEEDWNNPARLTDHFIVGPETLSIKLENLTYAQTYLFAIRVLHPDFVEKDANGNVVKAIESERHSKWYGMGTQREWARFLRLTTMDRYITPGVINVGNISEDRTAFTVYINLNAKNCVGDFKSEETYPTEEDVFEEFKQHFDLIEDGTEGSWQTAKFYFDLLTVTPSVRTPNGTVDQQFREYTIDPTSFVNGVAEIRVTGLSENCVYDVDLINTKRQVPLVDQKANSISKPVYGDPGEPITIKHVLRGSDSIPGETKYQAMILDNIFVEYPNNVELAEGQTFYLEGGKTYAFSSNPSITKGFVLETLPSDLAEGKRARVLLSGMGVKLNEDGSLGTEIATCNFMFGKRKEAGESDAPIEVGSVVFRNVDFDCPEAVNFGMSKEHPEIQASPSGNYFMNMYSDGMAVTFQELRIENCTFQGIIRGFIRTQGNKPSVFDKLVFNGNLIYNCGYYAADGRGFGWFRSPGNTNCNMFKDFWFTNNTIYNSPNDNLIGDSDKNITFPSSIVWNIHVENNTFVNFSTRKTDRHFFQTRYIPNGSHYTFKNNLIVLAADEKDSRTLNQTVADVREVKGAGQFTFDIQNNYSLGCRPAHLVDNGIVDSGKGFNATKNNFGAASWAPGLVDANGTPLADKSSLIIKAVRDDAGNALKATDVFTNPNPPYVQYNASTPNSLDHAAPADIFSALKYKYTPSVLQSVGDARWSSSDPKTFYENN